jgi:acetoacetate decarboxylase
VHTAPPIVNVRHFARLAAGHHDDPAVHELVRARSRDRAISEIWEGAAELELFEAPGEEHTLLGPVEVARGYRFTFAYTVDDLESVRDYVPAADAAGIGSHSTAPPAEARS